MATRFPNGSPAMFEKWFEEPAVEPLPAFNNKNNNKDNNNNNQVYDGHHSFERDRTPHDLNQLFFQVERS